VITELRQSIYELLSVDGKSADILISFKADR